MDRPAYEPTKGAEASVAELAQETEQILAGLGHVRARLGELVRRARRLREECWAAQAKAAELRAEAARLRVERRRGSG